MFAILIAILTVNSAIAGKIKVHSPEERLEYIRQADVWVRPPWISEDFRFINEIDLFNGPAPNGFEKYLANNEVYCRMNEEQAVRPHSSGKTPKFFCDLLIKDEGSQQFFSILKDSGKPRELKVKYHYPRGEIPSEVLGTRLLWALGFPVDRMFYVEKAFCFNCPNDPFENRGLDPAAYLTPRLFEPVAIETKFKGEAIETEKEEGWEYGELKYVSENPVRAHEQRMHRDALKLLSAFLQHSDNKMANQRLVCTGEISDNGRCAGQVIMMIQDLGALFGKGRTHPWAMSRVDLRAWQDTELWSDAENCRAYMGLNFSGLKMWEPRISEEGRQFLVKLIDGFTHGEEGRKRLIELFRAGRVELRGHTAEEWAEVFLAKFEAMKFPLGRKIPAFKCPKTIKQ